MKKIVFLLTIFIYTVSLSQNYFNEKYIYNSIDYGAALNGGLLLDNDTIIVEGFIVKWITANNRNGYVAKLTMQGDMIDFVLLDTTKYYWNYPRSITKTQSKGYLLSGIYDSQIDHSCCFITKLTHNLDTIWVKRLCHTDSTKKILSIANIEVPNGNIYLLCDVWKYQGNVGVVDNNTMLILLDAQGNEISRREWGVGYAREIPRGFLETPWALLGYGYGAFLTSNINAKGGYILEIDTACNIDNVYITPTSDSVAWFSSLALTSDTNLLACGIMSRQNPTTQDWSCFGYIAKYSPPPYQQIWKILFPLANCEYSRFEKVVATPDGGGVICGNDYTLPIGKGKGWMIKVNKDGQIVWDRRHTLITGGDHYFSDMVRNTDGGFSLVGYIYSHNSDPIGTYAWLARTDSFGCLVPGCQTVGIAAGENVSYKMLISPNPTADFLNVYIAQKPDFEGFLRLYDTNGKVVLSGAVSGQDKTYIFPVRGLPSGVYYLEMSAQGRILHTEKVVKE